MSCLTLIYLSTAKSRVNLDDSISKKREKTKHAIIMIGKMMLEKIVRDKHGKLSVGPILGQNAVGKRGAANSLQRTSARKTVTTIVNPRGN